MLFCGTISLYFLKGQDMVTYKINPDLLLVKPDWKGNVVINGKYQNDTISESAPFFDVPISTNITTGQEPPSAKPHVQSC